MTDHPPSFRFIDHNGTEIANGPLSLLDEALRARSTAEGAIAAAARAAGQMARIQARADALDQKEHELEQREDACRAIQADAMRRFVDDVLKLSHRFDKFEQRSIQAKIDALPDPDRPDDGDLEAPKPAKPEPDDGALEVEESKSEAETAIGDQNPGDLPEGLLAGAPAPPGSYPTMGRESPQLPQPIDISLSAADAASPAFVCGRDRRAFMRRQRNQTWQR
jgi:hypothetical protein